MKRLRGFTLLELMVSIAIIGVLMAAGMPSLFKWISNVRIRNGAEAFQNGMRLAQVEAVRRNTVMTLRLTADTAPTISSAASPTGVNWIIFDSANVVTQSKGTEGSTGLVQTPLPSTGFTGEIKFFGLGTDNLPATTKFTFTNSATSTSADHPIAVMLSTSGRVRMCDPARPAGDPQACE